MKNQRTFNSYFVALLVGVSLILMSFSMVSDYRVIPRKGFTQGELIEYRVHYGIINAATAKVEVGKNIVYVNQRPCYRVSITGRTVGPFDLISRVRDTWRSHMDTAAVLPQLFERDIQEGKYRLDEKVVFNHLTNTATVTSKKRNQEAVKFTIPKNAQDLVGSYYYLRTIDFQQIAVGKVMEIPMFFDNEVYKLKVRFAGKEVIKTRYGRLETYKLIPYVPANRFFKGEYPMTIWVSNDVNRVPLKVEVNLKIGSLGLEITNYSGLKSEFKWM